MPDGAALVSGITVLNSISKTIIDALKASKFDAEVGKFQQAILEANSYALTAQQQQFSLTSRASAERVMNLIVGRDLALKNPLRQ